MSRRRLVGLAILAVGAVLAKRIYTWRSGVPQADHGSFGATWPPCPKSKVA